MPGGKKLIGDVEKKPSVELIVSTYLPTKIIKSITIKEPGKGYSDTITLSAHDAKYLFEQLKALYGEGDVL